jgi:cytochrome c-type biogenesis protein
MGIGALWIGIVTDAMPASGGWQARLSARLQHYGKVITDALSWIPGWAAVVLLLIVVELLARLAFHQIVGRGGMRKRSVQNPPHSA